MAALAWLIPWIDVAWVSLNVCFINWVTDELTDKRGLDDSGQHAVFKFNRTSHTGAEIERLQDLSVKIVPGRKAIFTGNDFEVEGNATEHQVTNGLKHGDVSFYVPGIDTPIDGTYITVDVGKDKESEAAFGYLVGSLKETRNKESTLDDMIEAIKENEKAKAC